MSKLLTALRRRIQRDEGFTLIELLVVILIIGILAAVAIPLFLNQQGKAYDSNAVSLAKNAQIAEQTYATGNNGSYTTSVSNLLSIDPSLSVTGTLSTSAAPASPALAITTTAPTGMTGTYSYIIESQAQTSGDIYYLGVTAAGQEVHYCTETTTPGSGAPGDCSSATW